MNEERSAGQNMTGMSDSDAVRFETGHPLPGVESGGIPRAESPPILKPTLGKEDEGLLAKARRFLKGL